MPARPGGGKPLLLEIDLTAPAPDDPPSDPLSWLQSRNRPHLRTIVDRLEEAADDARVAGLVVKLGAVKMPVAQAQELRAALHRFGRSGKPSFGWAETFGEFGPGSIPYLVACACSEVWLQPSGNVGLLGVASERPFLRGTLDRLHVQPLFGQRYEYKNAADLFMRHDMSDAQREVESRLVQSLYEQLVAAVATDRGLAEDKVRELVDRAPLLAGEALDAGLVDRLGYRDEVYSEARRRCGGDVSLLFLSRYRRYGRAATMVRQISGRGRPVVALVPATGAITQGHSGRGGTPTGRKLGSDTVTAALRAATRDPHVRAIVFRVDSPGGSYVASDAIWREVCQARADGKTVVVSMGTLAGSGGYFVSMSADVIVALPGTYTGSIGVLHGKLLNRDMFERIGLHLEPVRSGRHALMFSGRTDFAESEWARLNDWLDAVYADFTGKVAQGRGMTVEQVHEVARGRVWTGADAKERGLVDELGGLSRAVELARERAGLPADAPVRRFPAVAPLQRLQPAKNSEHPAAVGYVGGWGEWAGLAAALGLSPAGPLTMPALSVRM
jgi:protease-4